MSHPSPAQCIREILADEACDPVLQEVGAQTGGLSLWMEMPGCHVVLLPTGDGLWFDPEDGATGAVDPVQHRLLHIKAAERYPTLGFLRPVPGPDAAECPACKGTGRLDVRAAFGEIMTPEECDRLPLDVLHEGRCWDCLGLRWIDSDAPRPPHAQ